MATKVAVAGGTGNLGHHIVKNLAAAKYPVTILTRRRSIKTSKLSRSDNIAIREVDYSSIESLSGALQGINVVISALGPNYLDAQTSLIDASVDAGVTRFLPSEFGSDTSNPKTAQLPVFKGKVETQKYLCSKVKENPNFSYTILANGAFFDWGLQVGLILNLANHSASVYNGGDVKFSVTTLDCVGKAVVGVIKHLDETKDRAVYVQDALVTQNQLIAYAKERDVVEWHITAKDTAKIYDESMAELQKGPAANIGSAMVGFILSSLFGDGYGGDFSSHLDNELLGLKGLTDEQVKKLVQSFLSPGTA